MLDFRNAVVKGDLRENTPSVIAEVMLECQKPNSHGWFRPSLGSDLVVPYIVVFDRIEKDILISPNISRSKLFPSRLATSQQSCMCL